VTISLDGVTLDDSMVWRERYSSSGVAQTVRRTLGGVPVVFAETLEKGVPITLAATEVNGMLLGALRRSVVTQILARAAVTGAVYILNFNGVTYSVIFRHDDPPAVAMEPISPRTADANEDYFRGEIKLLTV
jgi:hypothetical protein